MLYTMNMIKASNNIQDLTGKGIEYLTDETGEYIRAVFIDGNFERAYTLPSKEESEANTIIAA